MISLSPPQTSRAADVAKWTHWLSLAARPGRDERTVLGGGHNLRVSDENGVWKTACYNSPKAERGCVRRKYRKPPIAEAVCEFRFRGSTEWDWTIPGIVYQLIKADFPEKRQEKGFEIKITPKEGRIEPSASGSLLKMQFVKQDGSAMLQLGPDLLAINVYPPYPGWETFEALIRQQLEIYIRVADPVGFRRIGLRVINKIAFPTRGIEMTEYFHYYPHLPESVEQKHGPFLMRVLHAYEEERDLFAVQMTHIQQSDKSLNLAIGLDLDYYLAQPDKLELAGGMGWVSRAHDRVEAMFEACITDKTRELFEELK
jgi:uncharacterized protein (TIGR04255 family)